MQSDFIMSFSVDSAGTLYGASMMALYTIDTATASATKVLEFVGAATTPSRVMGIAFDKNDQLYVADFVDLPQGGSTIYTLDLDNGILTPIVRTGFAFVHNIAFMPDYAPIAREMDE
jgi:DNA-binding beta-propeller fold protein YncE